MAPVEKNYRDCAGSGRRIDAPAVVAGAVSSEPMLRIAIGGAGQRFERNYERCRKWVERDPIEHGFDRSLPTDHCLASRLIDEARAVVGSVRGIFGQVRTISQVSVASATLPSPRQPDAPPEVRNLIDMTDAVAQAAMKRAIETLPKLFRRDVRARGETGGITL